MGINGRPSSSKPDSPHIFSELTFAAAQMEPIEFQTLAESLAETEEPAALRTAVSRAYYAVFHAATALALELTIRVPISPKGHAFLKDVLANSNDADLAAVAVKLQTLMSQRIIADYRLHARRIETALQTRPLVAIAKRAIESIQEFPHGKRRDTAKSAMKQYLRVTRQG